VVRVSIQLLGGFGIEIDGRRVPEAALRRRDATALVKRLALAPGRRLHREQLAHALWPDVEPAAMANRLHKAGHFVRKATGSADAVVAGGQSIALFPDADVSVDATEFDAIAEAALRSGNRDVAERALALWGGELLPLDVYEEWSFGLRQRFARRHRELLRVAGRYAELVAIEPADEAAHVALMRGLLDAGDRTGALRQFDALVRALDHELGIGPSVEAQALRTEAIGDGAADEMPASEQHRNRFTPLATQTVQRCVAPDGVRLAYATSGSGPPLVKASTWLTHLDFDWSSPVWRHWWQALSRRHTLVRYDERGCGLSDWELDRASFTLDAWVRDLEVVVDTLGLERFPLLGISQGGPIAITYAARHPERVSAVVVLGTCAGSTWERASPELQRELLALDELIGLSWGGDQPGFRQVYDARFLPDGPLEAWRAFDDLQRRTTSPRNAQRFWRAFGMLEYADAARALDVPTLILHARDDQVWRFEEAERLHAMVRGSRLVALESRNHILQEGEPAFAQFMEALESFLDAHP
jgi:DNA-binding SARP family transcriptional activator/pimeloyl-ACP methyl ester carboxylesterase